ncbi:MAG: VTC domain-containing protein [Candidatus Latescibacteria bacterium]|nr:VTC domain-containing protein [Candidatus Latescibacterota bacterium]
MKRLEYKYLVRAQDLAPLRRALAPFLDTDANAAAGGRGEYTVRSIYYDSRRFDYYHQKEAGILDRKKLRIRAYDLWHEEAMVFLEIKRKYDMRISKDRAPMLHRHLPQLLGSGQVDRYRTNSHLFPRAVEEANSFFFHLRRYGLHPTVLVSYEREAFFRKFNPALRITFDKNLRGLPFPDLDSLYSDQAPPTLPDHFILEIKFRASYPAWLKPILGDFRLERMALSKYALCLEAHQLPGKAFPTARSAPLRPRLFA